MRDYAGKGELEVSSAVFVVEEVQVEVSHLVMNGIARITRLQGVSFNGLQD